MLRTSFIARVALCFALAEGAVLPTFVFPEEEDVYFAQNIEILKTDIGRALDDGCLDAWPLEDQTEIAVVFRHDSMVPETSDFYIQYQMEQVAADKAEDAAVGFRSLADHVQYKRKLAGALQVWEWSPHQMDFLKTAMPVDVARKLSYVPLSASTDATDGCDAVLDEEWCQEFEQADVLFFGAMTESRKQLCKMVDAEMDRLKRAGNIFSHQCVSGIFGEALKCKVCKAKVVYSDHSRKGASLEVHRINQMLAQGKAIVSAKSADKFLDSMYQSAIELVDSEEIPKTISKLLLDNVRRMKLEWRSYALSQQLQRKAQPVLCQALRSMATLASDSLNSVNAWKREGLQDYVPYLADRRLQTGNGSNVTNSTPTPATAPMPSTTSALPTTSTQDLAKIRAEGIAALVASENICQDPASVPAFNAAIALLANTAVANVDSNCSATASNTPSGGRRLASVYDINMSYAVELTVAASDSEQASLDLLNKLRSMNASALQSAFVQQLASANKTFNVTVAALTAPEVVKVTSVTSGEVVIVRPTTTAPYDPYSSSSSSSSTSSSTDFITTTDTTSPPSPTPSPMPSPTPTSTAPPTTSMPPSPTPSPTPTGTPSPTPSPTPVAAPTPSPAAPTPSPTEDPSPTPTPSPSPSLIPTPPAVDEEESGSMRMCQIFMASAAVILASLLF